MATKLNRDFIELLVNHIETPEERIENYHKLLARLYQECPSIANDVEIFVDQYVAEATDLALMVGWLAREDPTRFLSVKE
jgi:hypothetical protein